MCSEHMWLFAVYGEGVAQHQPGSTLLTLCTAPIFGHELVTLVGVKTPA